MSKLWDSTSNWITIVLVIINVLFQLDNCLARIHLQKHILILVTTLQTSLKYPKTAGTMTPTIIWFLPSQMSPAVPGPHQARGRRLQGPPVAQAQRPGEATREAPAFPHWCGRLGQAEQLGSKMVGFIVERWWSRHVFTIGSDDKWLFYMQKMRQMIGPTDIPTLSIWLPMITQFLGLFDNESMYLMFRHPNLRDTELTLYCAVDPPSKTFSKRIVCFPPNGACS